jgi:hypothetical protein
MAAAASADQLANRTTKTGLRRAVRRPAKSAGSSGAAGFSISICVTRPARNERNGRCVFSPVAPVFAEAVTPLI